MRVLALDQYGELGGAQQCLLDLAPALVGAGMDLHAAAPDDGPLLDRLERTGARVHRLELRPLGLGRKTWQDHVRFVVREPRLRRRLRALLDEQQPDLIYVNGPRLLPSACKAAGSTPLLFHCHHRLDQSSAAWLARRSLRRIDSWRVSCCRYAAEPLGPAATGRERVVYNGVVGPADSSCDRRDEPPLVSVVGRIAPEKGQLHFVEAVAMLGDRFPGARFVICGAALFGADDGYEQRVRTAAEGLPIEFRGWRDDIYPLLASSSVLAVPSVAEPATTRVILEAFACATPVVAYATGGIPEVLTQGQGGRLIAHPDPAALARAIGELLAAPPAVRRGLGAAGRRIWAERFSLERYRREMLDMFESVAARRPLPPSCERVHG